MTATPRGLVAYRTYDNVLYAALPVIPSDVHANTQMASVAEDRPGGPSYFFSSATISAATARAFSSAPGSKLMAPTRACPPPP